MAHPVLCSSSSMSPEAGPPSPGLAPLGPDEVQAVRALAIHVAAQLTLSRAVEVLSDALTLILRAPLAVLSRGATGWHFEAHAFPDGIAGAALASFAISQADDLVTQLQNDPGHAWTAIAIGTFGDRDWALLVPGQSGAWASRPGFEDLVEHVGWSLLQVVERELADYTRRFHRRLHAFTRRIARAYEGERLNSIVLRAIASQVSARTGALAVFNAADDALAIVSTIGYPSSIVEHLRINPGEGLIGRAYASRKAVLRQAAADGIQRLRYATNSYMVLPVVAENQALAVIALTDRADGRPFSAEDFAAARLMASSAAPAFSRERLRTHLSELTEFATVDVVTGLFNRRYFETQLEAEVERSRRQAQDLALLLIDIDDFKRVNDTRGHLEGDRTLREVADLLRAGVRIFDVCARYGGEEFVIVMPSTSALVARQVAERIRARVERGFAHQSPPVTVSIGVGLLGSATTADELVDVADRALISAKKAGKNLVWTATETFPHVTP